MPKRITVLYICPDPSMGGSSASLLNLIESVRSSVYPIVLFNSKGVAYDAFNKEGIECYVVPYVCLHQLHANRLIDVWRHPWRWHKIKKIRTVINCYLFVRNILRGRRIDIVHSNFSLVDIGVLFAKQLNAKHIWHIREFIDLDFHFSVYGGVESLHRMIYHADARIAISNAIAKHHQLPAKNTFIVNDAIRSKKDICFRAEKEKYVLFSSYFLTKAKGTGYAIKAFEKSGLISQGFTLKLMGNIAENYEEELYTIINNSPCRQAIELVPCQKDVKPYFAKASAYIMASDCEGLGRVTAEAMFYGCPVIAHATGGTLDLVKDGETGYLYRTLEECAQLIRKVCIENQEPMILRAQDFAVNNLSQEVYGPKIMEVYNQVLKQ